MVQVMLGSYYSWPSIMVYAPPEFRTTWVMSGIMLSNLAALPFLTRAIVKLGPKKSVAVGSQVCALAVFLSSFVVQNGGSMGAFFALYSCLFGAVCDQTYDSRLLPRKGMRRSIDYPRVALTTLHFRNRRP